MEERDDGYESYENDDLIVRDDGYESYDDGTPPAAAVIFGLAVFG